MGERAREVRELVRRFKPDVVVASEVKSLSMESVQVAWPGANVQYVPPRRKSIVTAPRAGTALLIRADLVYSVAYVHNEWGEETNSLIRSVTIVKEHGVHVTGMYV